MTRKERREAPTAGLGCCRVASLVAVDERGQMVLPKKIRDQAGIRAGDQLALVSWEQEGEVWCLFLVKADRLTSMVREMLGPIMKGALGK